MSDCCYLVNHPRNSDCQPLGNIFNWGLSIHQIKSSARLPRDRVRPSPKGSRKFVDAKIANHRLMEPGIGLVNALRIALNLQLVEFDPRRKRRSSASAIFRRFSQSVSPLSLAKVSYLFKTERFHIAND